MPHRRVERPTESEMRPGFFAEHREPEADPALRGPHGPRRVRKTFALDAETAEAITRVVEGLRSRGVVTDDGRPITEHWFVVSLLAAAVRDIVAGTRPLETAEVERRAVILRL